MRLDNWNIETFSRWNVIWGMRLFVENNKTPWLKHELHGWLFQ